MKYETSTFDHFSRLAGGSLSTLGGIASLHGHVRDDPSIALSLVESLLSVSLDPDEAHGVFERIVEHHARLVERLGCDIDLRVAAMDYVTRHPDLVREPVVVDQNVLSATRRLAAVDELTGLYNRRFLNVYLEKELNRARRHRETFSVLFVDLDDFKSINDDFGHEAGDRVLVALSNEIQGLLRAEDFAARYGGEEFLVVLPHTDVEGAERFAARLSSGVAAMDLPHRARVTFSGGIATYPLHGSTIQELLRKSDAALYEAKSRGKAHVRRAVAEKRSARRHAADLRARCYLEGREIGEVRLHDISQAGVSVDAGTLLAPGQTMRFRIASPDSPPGPDRFEVLAQVIWSRKVDDVEYRVGGRWAAADAEVLQSLIARISGEKPA
ncbi:MAG TPA: diguanylate cyclase [Spirochaetia bacterium]|nr:diguanylate cyclase [Spirochaetia bacterium]